MGVMITVILYFSLVAANEGVKNLAEEDQLYEIGNLVYSEINRAYLHPGRISLIFDIPKKISGNGYKIYIGKTGSETILFVKLGQRTVKIPINNEYNASGMLFSSGGKVKIEKKEKKITIGRF